MKILMKLLVITGLAAAANIQSNQDASNSFEPKAQDSVTAEPRELQTVIYGSSRGRGRGRRTGTALFIVENDNDRSTARCADDTAEEFDRDFDAIFIVDDDDDARNGDVVAVVNRGTSCNRLWDDIEDELKNRHATTTVYVYYGSGSRYYRNRARSRKGYRLYGRKYGRSRRGWGGGWRKNNRSRDHANHYHNRSWGGSGRGKRSWSGSGGGKRSWGGSGHKRSWHGDGGKDKDHEGWKSGDDGSGRHHDHEGWKGGDKDSDNDD